MSQRLLSAGTYPEIMTGPSPSGRGDAVRGRRAFMAAVVDCSTEFGSGVATAEWLNGARGSDLVSERLWNGSGCRKIVVSEGRRVFDDAPTEQVGDPGQMGDEGRGLPAKATNDGIGEKSEREARENPIRLGTAGSAGQGTSQRDFECLPCENADRAGEARC